eukprot:TRINITY_DN57500_c0_g1_i1.p1 TRINITY_DN57500_c0_g1~~TRINITY_DN57500_c0_g1_i1.p1  ORF type:complete len:629 (-),score=63.07 TRINITY_DN57500_c0_g1_i1:1251-3137(-)
MTTSEENAAPALVNVLPGEEDMIAADGEKMARSVVDNQVHIARDLQPTMTAEFEEIKRRTLKNIAAANETLDAYQQGMKQRRSAHHFDHQAVIESLGLDAEMKYLMAFGAPNAAALLQAIRDLRMMKSDPIYKEFRSWIVEALARTESTLHQILAGNWDSTKMGDYLQVSIDAIKRVCQFQHPNLTTENRQILSLKCKLAPARPAAPATDKPVTGRSPRLQQLLAEANAPADGSGPSSFETFLMQMKLPEPESKKLEILEAILPYMKSKVAKCKQAVGQNEALHHVHIPEVEEIRGVLEQLDYGALESYCHSDLEKVLDAVKEAEDITWEDKAGREDRWGDLWEKANWNGECRAKLMEAIQNQLIELEVLGQRRLEQVEGWTEVIKQELTRKATHEAFKQNAMALADRLQALISDSEHDQFYLIPAIEQVVTEGCELVAGQYKQNLKDCGKKHIESRREMLYVLNDRLNTITFLLDRKQEKQDRLEVALQAALDRESHTSSFDPTNVVVRKSIEKLKADIVENSHEIDVLTFKQHHTAASLISTIEQLQALDSPIPARVDVKKVLAILHTEESASTFENNATSSRQSPVSPINWNAAPPTPPRRLPSQQPPAPRNLATPPSNSTSSLL